MKQRNLILAALVLLFCAKGALAADNEVQASGVQDAAVEAARIAEVEALLKRLGELGAIGMDEKENIRVRKSVLDKLKTQGRFNEVTASFSSVCD
jgi:hypothetical protein